MPKEMTHWVIAEKIANRLPDGLIRKALFTNRAFYELGAIIHDSPFYSASTNYGKSFNETAEMIHGDRDGDPYEPCLRLSELPIEKRSGPFIAFLAGIITHMQADINFHPLIYYFCGDSEERHYKLEALMDLFFTNGKSLNNNGLLKSTLKNLRDFQDEIYLLVGTFYGVYEKEFPQIRRFLKKHALIQSFFKSVFLRKIANGLEIIYHKKFGKISALFYPNVFPNSAPFFNKPLTYKKPANGFLLRESVSEIEGKTVSNSIRLITQMENILKTKELKSFFSQLRKISLVSGCDPCLGNPMNYTDTSKSIETLVFKQ